VQPGQNRARRYSFAANIELTDMQSEAQITARTSDLSLFGCRVNTLKTLPTGTRVRIRITHSGATFVAMGRVAYTRLNSGMGIVFTNV